MRLDAVIFDYGDVLSLPQPAEAQARLEALAGVEAARFWAAYWACRQAYDRGAVDGPGYWACIGVALGRAFSPEEVRQLVAADIASWTSVNETMVAWAAALRRAGLWTAVLSNMTPDIRDHVTRTFDWLRAFDCTSLSCDIGALKPEPAIYRHCLGDEAGHTSNVAVADFTVRP